MRRTRMSRSVRLRTSVTVAVQGVPLRGFTTMRQPTSSSVRLEASPS